MPDRDHAHMMELLTLHALGATDDDERVLVESHLVTCHECRDELVELTRDAALLGQASYEAPPAGLRARVLDAIDELADSPAAPAHDPATVVPLRPSGRFQRRRFAMPALAAASIVLAIGVAVQSVRVDDLRDELDSSRAGVVRVEGDGVLSAARINVAYVEGDRPRLEFAEMPQPPTAHAWQAWAVHADGTMSSLGTMERNSRITALLVDDGAVEVAITLEPSGGSVQPTTEPIARGAITT